jgi:hypothetical protein
MPQVYICHRCAEKIAADTQDWVIVSIDTTGNSGLEIRAHAECEVARLKKIQANGHQGLVAVSRNVRS